MKLPAFDYHAPRSLDHALELLREHGDEARVLAGGQSLLPMMAMRLARPSVLVDFGQISSLDGITVTDDTVSLGAMLRERQAEESDVVRRRLPLLADALPLIGHDAIRNRGTIGGSIAHADPAAEIPTVALALDASIVVVSADRGERAIAAADFFQGFLTTSIEDDEAVLRIEVPAASPQTGTSFCEMARRHGDFAIVGAAVAVDVHDGRISSARIALMGVDGLPLRRTDAEHILAGSAPTAACLEAAAEAASRDLNPPSDMHGSSPYRKHMATVLVRRGLDEALRRAQEEPA